MDYTKATLAVFLTVLGRRTHQYLHVTHRLASRSDAFVPLYFAQPTPWPSVDCLGHMSAPSVCGAAMSGPKAYA